jgi:predicted HD phosphohydrolase
MALPVHEILGLFRIRGAASYDGEPASQLDHALQCAQLAEEAGSTPELVAASLLHDPRHLLVERPQEMGRDANDLHQFHPLPFLRGVFPNAVLGPIRLHVEAKRHLCRADLEHYAHVLEACAFQAYASGTRWT